MKTKPQIQLNFRGTKISKTLDTVDQFRRCLEFLYDEDEDRTYEVRPCPCCGGTGAEKNA